jgi:catechol 2,3-dioxygenase-like lactoylglutathione lyase family enzyme
MAKLAVGTNMTSIENIGASVGHIGIEVSSLSRSRRFYKTLLEGLGLKLLRDTPEYLGFNNQNFSVWIGELKEPRVSRKAPTGEEEVVFDHIAIHVNDKDAVYGIEEVMKKAGFTALFPCQDHPQFRPGYYAVSFCDPDNFVIKFVLPFSTRCKYHRTFNLKLASKIKLKCASY